MRSAEKKVDQEQAVSPEGAVSQSVNYEEAGIVPPQYAGMPSDVVEELWTMPTMVDPKRNAELVEWRNKALESLRQQESDRESGKEASIKSEYRALSPQEIEAYGKVQQRIVGFLGDLVRVGVDLRDAPSEEQLVFSKMQHAYRAAQEEKPGQSVTLKLDRDIDKRVYANLVQRWTLDELGAQRKKQNKDRLKELQEEFGISSHAEKSIEGDVSDEHNSSGLESDDFKRAFGAISGGFAEAGARKVQEYDARIRALRAGRPLKEGERMEDLLAGFRQFTHKEWTEDFDLQKSDQERKASVVAESGPSLSTAERKKLTGWDAAFALAKIAQQRGVDLSSLSREEYAQLAIDESLAIDDNQLRAAAWERTATSAMEVVAGAQKIREGSKDADKAFKVFEDAMKAKAGQADRFISDGVRVRQGTGTSESWLFFGVNGSIPEGRAETFKAYISFKDLSAFRPEKFTAFLGALRDAGYNGDVKIFQDLGFQAIHLNDQVVMHGASKKDAELALQTAERFFGSDLATKGTGKDETIDGKEMSYSQILARKIREAIDKKKA